MRGMIPNPAYLPNTLLHELGSTPHRCTACWVLWKLRVLSMLLSSGITYDIFLLVLTLTTAEIQDQSRYYLRVLDIIWKHSSTGSPTDLDSRNCWQGGTETLKVSRTQAAGPQSQQGGCNLPARVRDILDFDADATGGTWTQAQQRTGILGTADKAGPRLKRPPRPCHRLEHCPGWSSASLSPASTTVRQRLKARCPGLGYCLSLGPAFPAIHRILVSGPWLRRHREGGTWPHPKRLSASDERRARRSETLTVAGQGSGPEVSMA